MPKIEVGLASDALSMSSTNIARIGPNSVIQLARAVEDTFGETSLRRLFTAAGYEDLVDATPRDMIDERIPAALFRALWEVFPERIAQSIARQSGKRTADYILQNRIPKIVQYGLRLLPTRLAARLLLRAIEKNAWTFAGSGACRVQGEPALIEIANNPLRMPGCCWHAAVFERLFAELVSPSTDVIYAAISRDGVKISQFALSFHPKPAASLQGA